MTIGLEECIARVCHGLLMEVGPREAMTRISVHLHDGLTLMKSRDETNICLRELGSYFHVIL